MSIHLTNYEAIFFHIQKTGGRWVGGAISDVGIKTTTCHKGGNKNTYRSVPTKNKYLFTFIRHPFAWYRSYWAQRTETKWRNDWIDVYKASTLEQFILNILKTKRPYASEMFKYYIGDPRVLDFVGLNENMANDLIKVLTTLNIKFDEKVILNKKPINTSKAKPKCSKELIDKIIDLEFWTISQYYRGTPYEDYIYEFAKGKE